MSLGAGLLAAGVLFAGCGVEATLGRLGLDAGAEPDSAVARADAALATPDAAVAPSDSAVETSDAASAADRDAAVAPLTEADQMFCDARGGGPGCGFCLGDTCCREILGCVEDADCDCWLECTRTLTPLECQAECPAPPALWSRFVECSDAACAVACPPLG